MLAKCHIGPLKVDPIDAKLAKKRSGKQKVFY